MGVMRERRWRYQNRRLDGAVVCVGCAITSKTMTWSSSAKKTKTVLPLDWRFVTSNLTRWIIAWRPTQCGFLNDGIVSVTSTTAASSSSSSNTPTLVSSRHAISTIHPLTINIALLWHRDYLVIRVRTSLQRWYTGMKICRAYGAYSS